MSRAFRGAIPARRRDGQNWVDEVTVTPIRNAGGEPITNTPEEFAAYIKSEIARWGKAVKAANLPLQ